MQRLKEKLISSNRYKDALRKCLEKPAVLLAPTNYCNLSCSYCSTKDIKNPKVNMPLPLVKNIVEQTVDNGWSLFFGQTYEPFLHPNIVEIISFVHEKGIIFNSATNAMAIGKELYDLPMSLLVSYSANEEDYKYRGTAVSFERYQRKLHDFFSHRIKNGTPGIISLQIADYSIFNGDLGYDKSITDIDGIIDKTITLSRNLGLAVCPDKDHWRGLVAQRRPLELFRDNETVIQVQPTKILPNSYDAFMQMDTPSEAMGYCDSCYTMMSIQADGKVGLCCCDPSAKAIAGILDEQTNLKDFWMGKEMTTVRKGFEHFAPIHPFCTQCLSKVTENIKPLLTTKRPSVVASILRDYGVETDLPWFKFPECE